MTTTPERESTPLLTALEAVELVNNDPDRARQLAEQALAEPAATSKHTSVATRVLGMVATLRSTLPAADRLLRDAIAIADAAGLPARAAEARASLAYVLTLSGSTQQALDQLSGAIPVLSGISAARAGMLRALVLTEIGDLDAAEIGFAAAVSSLQAAGGDDLLEADLRNNRAVLRIHQRNWAAVDEDQQLAEALYLANGHRGRTALIFHNRGVAATTRGDLPAALAAYDEAELRYQQAGRTSGLLPVERAEALLAVLLVTEARAAAEQAVSDFTSQGNAVDLVQARLVLARAALLTGDPRLRSAASGSGQAVRRSATATRLGGLGRPDLVAGQMGGGGVHRVDPAFRRADRRRADRSRPAGRRHRCSVDRGQDGSGPGQTGDGGPVARRRAGE